jgi:hypothetical protein
MPHTEQSFPMRRIALAAMLAAATFGIGAEPVKCVDASGKVRYIDESMAGQEKCKPVRAEIQVMPAQPGAATPYRPPATSSAPSAAQTRLTEAESRLTAAEKLLAEQEAIRSGDERNYARVLERLKPFQDAVQNAEKEVEQARIGLRDDTTPSRPSSGRDPRTY